MHYADFFAGSIEDCCIILEPNLTNKPRDVHLYCTLMACGDGVSLEQPKCKAGYHVKISVETEELKK